MYIVCYIPESTVYGALLTVDFVCSPSWGERKTKLASKRENERESDFMNAKRQCTFV